MERTNRTRGDDTGSSTTAASSVGKRAPTDSLRAPVQAKSEKAPAEAPTTDPSAVAGSGAPLDPGVSSGMGAHMGQDFSNVKVHQGGAVDGALEGAGAKAMAQGNDLYFKSGEYNPGSPAGNELIGHELAHVAQQRDGQTSGLNAKDEDGVARNSLESDADQKGAAAAKAVDGPFDWNSVDSAAYDAEIKRRESTGEPIPLGKTLDEVRATPLAREIASKCSKGAKPAAAPSPVGVPQHKKVWNTGPLGGVYNEVEILDEVASMKFIEIDKDMPASFNLGNYMGCKTKGMNSERDGNFGVTHTGPSKNPLSYNYDGFKSARWNYPTQSETGGAGPHTLSMHNWAFTNIEVSQTFGVVEGVVSAIPGEIARNVPALDAKIPVSVNGPAKVTVSQSEIVKTNSGWSIGQSIGQSTSVTRSMTAGLSVGLEQKDVAKVGAEAGISSSNTKTVVDSVNQAAGKAKTDVAKVGGSITVTGNASGEAANKYVIPVYNVHNFTVTAYPHDDQALVTGSPKTTNMAYFVLKDIQEIAADDEGKMTPGGTPSHAAAEDARIAEEAKGKSIEAGGKWLHVKVLQDNSMVKDYDHQDYTRVISAGVEQEINKEWSSELQNTFSITDSSGVKVSSTGGWNLGVSGGAGGAGKDAMGPSAGVKVGVSEMTTVAAEYGDVNAQSGSTSRAAEVKTSIKLKGTDDPHKATQVILTPMMREKVYEFQVYDKAKDQWEVVPAKARSRDYEPIPAVTQKEIPLGSAVVPEGAPKLDDTKLDGGAEDVKKLRAERDKIKDSDPIKAAEIDAKIEGKLASQREVLEDVVRRSHPSLEVIDRAKNLYKVKISVPDATNVYHEKDFNGTLESLMDLSPISPAVTKAADTLATKDADPKDDVTIKAQAGLGGTGAQGRTNPFPGDVDLSESIKITAPTADAAAQAFAASLKQTVVDATKQPTDGTMGYMFLKALVGAYPSDAKDKGPISWSQAEILGSQEKTFKGNDGKNHTITLAEAIASPGTRAANTHWRGPIDSSGTYGEITKVLNYEAVTLGGAVLFSSPKIGQAYQEVGFGDNALKHDTDRAKLLDALTPQIADYAKKKMWVKAMKRAYTVARMLNDIEALNAFAVLTRDDASELKTVSEHTSNFNDDIVKPGGQASSLLGKTEAKHQAQLLAHRIYNIDGAGANAGAAMDAAIALSGDDIRGDAKAHAHIEKQVIDPLEAALEGDKEYAASVAAALRAHGYLKDK